MSEQDAKTLPPHLENADLIPLIIPIMTTSDGQLLNSLTGKSVAVGKTGLLEDFKGFLPSNACIMTAEIGMLVQVARSKITECVDNTKSGSTRLTDGAFEITASEGVILASAKPLSELYADLVMQGYTDKLTVPKAEKIFSLGDSPVYGVQAAMRNDDGPQMVSIDCAAAGKAVIDIEAFKEDGGAHNAGVSTHIKGAGHIKIGAGCSVIVEPLEDETAKIDMQQGAEVEGKVLVVHAADEGVVRGADVSCFAGDRANVTATERCRVVHGREAVVEADLPGAIVSGLSGTHTLGAGATSVLVSGEQLAGSESVQVIEQGSQKGGQHAVQVGKRGVVSQEAGHHALQDAGDQAQQTAGHFAVMRAGNQSVQRAGDDAHLVAQEFAKQTAGNRATLIAGQGSVQAAGDDCLCSQRGPGGTVTLGQRSVFTLRGDSGQILYTLTAGVDFDAGVPMAVTETGLVPATEAGDSPLLVEGQI